MGRNLWNMNKSQRMQIKALICFLGILLLTVLFIGKLVVIFLLSGREPDEEVHIPVVEQLTNVWIMGADSDGILVFCDGEENRFEYGEVAEHSSDEETQSVYVGSYSPQGDVREQIADIVLTDGTVTDIRVKTEKINGRILSADETGVEVEGFGKLPLAQDYKGYRIFNTLTMCTVRDLLIGYPFADIVVENGKICALLLVREEAMESVRVLIKASDYSALLQEQVILTADKDFTIRFGTYENPKEEVHAAGEEITVDSASSFFSEDNAGDRIIITPNVLTGKVILKGVNRSQGVPSYRGHMELLRTADGIAVVNELPLEEYLYSVVPSEMPASYPNNALQAQAVCARTYAYGHMRKAGYPQYGAHVDDSTSYQVYNNILEQASTTSAVKETYGKLLYTANGDLAGAYYYSTSCGVGSDANVWKTTEAQTLDYLRASMINLKTMEKLVVEKNMAESDTAQSDEGEQNNVKLLQNEENFASFIESKNIDDFEVTEGWYRWTYQVKNLDAEHICVILQKRYEANAKLVLTLKGEAYESKPIKSFKEIRDIYVAKRGAGGIADELIIVTEKETYKVVSEHNIRYVLNDGESKVLRQDGSLVDAPTILPSGFFVLSASKEKENVVGYTLSGGGFGHGVGMSQNGAKHMANAGFSADEILNFFYDGCSIRNIYENQ